MIGRMATLSRRGNGDGHVVGDYTPPGDATSRITGPSLGKTFTSECKVFARAFLKSISTSVT